MDRRPEASRRTRGGLASPVDYRSHDGDRFGRSTRSLKSFIRPSLIHSSRSTWPSTTFAVLAHPRTVYGLTTGKRLSGLALSLDLELGPVVSILTYTSGWDGSPHPPVGINPAGTHLTTPGICRSRGQAYVFTYRRNVSSTLSPTGSGASAAGASVWPSGNCSPNLS
jgi:hypothetical protein